MFTDCYISNFYVIQHFWNIATLFVLFIDIRKCWAQFVLFKTEKSKSEVKLPIQNPVLQYLT